MKTFKENVKALNAQVEALNKRVASAADEARESAFRLTNLTEQLARTEQLAESRKQMADQFSREKEEVRAVRAADGWPTRRGTCAAGQQAHARGGRAAAA